MFTAIIVVLVTIWVFVVITKIVVKASAPSAEKQGYEGYKANNNVYATKEFSHQSYGQGVAARFVIDDLNKKVVVSNIGTVTEIPYAEIIGCEILTDSAVTGGVGRAVAGSMIAGDVGAIVGASTAKRKVSSYKIIIYRNNINHSDTTITLINSEVNTNHVAYKDAVTFATNVNASIKAIIAQNAQQLPTPTKSI